MLFKRKQLNKIPENGKKISMKTHTFCFFFVEEKNFLVILWNNTDNRILKSKLVIKQNCFDCVLKYVDVCVFFLKNNITIVGLCSLEIIEAERGKYWFKFRLVSSIFSFDRIFCRFHFEHFHFLFFFPGFLLLNTHIRILIGHMGTKCQNWIRDILKRCCSLQNVYFEISKRNKMKLLNLDGRRQKNQTMWYEKKIGRYYLIVQFHVDDIVGADRVFLFYVFVRDCILSRHLAIWL